MNKIKNDFLLTKTPIRSKCFKKYLYTKNFLLWMIFFEIMLTKALP